MTPEQELRINFGCKIDSLNPLGENFEMQKKIIDLADSRCDLPPNAFMEVPRDYFTAHARGDYYQKWIQEGMPCEVMPGFIYGDKSKCGKRGGVVVEYDIPISRDMEARIVCSSECYAYLKEGILFECDKNNWFAPVFAFNGFGRA